DSGDGDAGVPARVDATHVHVGASCDGGEQGCRRRGDGDQALHARIPPPKLAAEKLWRRSAECSPVSARKKFPGRATPLAASFSRKCGFNPVQASGLSRRVTWPGPPVWSSGGLATKMSCKVIRSDSM